MKRHSHHAIRYNDVAVILHWLIALLLIGLLALGKYMHILEDDDPLKYLLVQWHKSFGIVALLLIVIRLLWRTTYTAPAHPADAPAWEKLAAKLTHVALYALMLILPLSGWLMVSASPLNLDTILFNVVKWPHVPGAELLQQREMAGTFKETHEIAGGVLILLLLMHIGAALKHHIINKDDVLRRMVPDWQSRSFKSKLAAAIIAIAVAIAGLVLLANTKQQPARVITANNSSISFNTIVTGEPTPGQFNESIITLTLDDSNPSASQLTAELKTASVFTDNYQVNGSLPETDWFNVADHPSATFISDAVSKTADDYLIKGTLTIKGVSNSIEFPMAINEENGKPLASGQFVINRLDYQLGATEQPDDEYVGIDVTIEFKFEL